jgi:hypothetical protein
MYTVRKILTRVLHPFSRVADDQSVVVDDLREYGAAEDDGTLLYFQRRLALGIDTQAIYANLSRTQRRRARQNDNKDMARFVGEEIRMQMNLPSDSTANRHVASDRVRKYIEKEFPNLRHHDRTEVLPRAVAFVFVPFESEIAAREITDAHMVQLRQKDLARKTYYVRRGGLMPLVHHTSGPTKA